MRTCAVCLALLGPLIAWAAWAVHSFRLLYLRERGGVAWHMIVDFSPAVSFWSKCLVVLGAEYSGRNFAAIAKAMKEHGADHEVVDPTQELLLVDRLRSPMT
eukprot:gnl/TRDRNA2_/TRDRNA2_164886_c0_seq4.p2 gnl/TRDRNA2_/TRDRNA2_164886_c0~~gnl/TRDRNA2_/TRDRNA2_164886_c0_seq4.p2  ORF type:complete len:102 (+),score=9.80 gnl/TRDRNA2_/TRDRNA2_164886_c0_seq4:37-342(+)